jgi:DNA invertase Pin-like site-specific DNA recombinase
MSQTRQGVNQMKKAVIYARYSPGPNQTEYSIEGQLRECRAYAKREGFVIIQEYADRKKSGSRNIEKRTQFQKMVSDSASRQFEYVLIYSTDRFARSRYDSAIFKFQLRLNGVRVVSAKENIAEDASGILVESMLEGMAEFQSAKLSEDIKRGLKDRMLKFKFTGRSVPLGFRICEEKDYHIDPAKAKIIVQIYEMFLAGHKLKEIGEAVSKEYGLVIGNPCNYIGRILDNPEYIGTYTKGGSNVPNAIPRIVSDEMFERVRIIRDKKRKTPAAGRAYEEYILTTKLFCGHCNSMMVGTSGTGKAGKTYHYYGCPKSFKKNECFEEKCKEDNCKRKTCKKNDCTKKNIHKNWMEDFIVAKAEEQLTDENILLIAKTIADISKRAGNSYVISDLQSQLKENAKAMENLLKAIESGQHMDILSERISKKREEKIHLETLLAKEEMSRSELDEYEIRYFLNKLKEGGTMTPESRRALVAIFINKIVLYDNDPNDPNKRARIIFNASDRPVEIDYELLGEMESLENGEISEGERCSYMIADTPLNCVKSELMPIGDGFGFVCFI